MNKINWNELEEFEIISGLYGKFYHTNNMTFVRWRFNEGAELPAHNHFHEQVVLVLEGELKLTVGEDTHILKSGDVISIASNVPHGGKALVETIALDVFNPVREDFKEKYK